MDRLTGLRVFREIVATGSFSGAAERLGISAPIASKHIAQHCCPAKTRTNSIG
jgi:DNA-binding transcriptional LysR family regulator